MKRMLSRAAAASAKAAQVFMTTVKTQREVVVVFKFVELIKKPVFLVCM